MSENNEKSAEQKQATPSDTVVAPPRAGMSWHHHSAMITGINDQKPGKQSHTVDVGASWVSESCRKFAVSDCEYLPGLITLYSSGFVIHDPKSSGPEDIVSLNKALGYKQVGFEQLIHEIVNSEVQLLGPDAALNEYLTDYFADTFEQGN